MTLDDLLDRVQSGDVAPQDVAVFRSFLTRLRQIVAMEGGVKFQYRRHCNCARCQLYRLLGEYGIA